MRGRGVSRERFPGPVDVIGIAACQSADGRPLHLPGDGLHRLEVARRSNRIARLDDVHAEVLERMGDFEFLGQVHTGPRRLLPIAQRGIENNQAVSGHGRTPLGKNPSASEDLVGCLAWRSGSDKRKKPWNFAGPRAGVISSLLRQTTAHLGPIPRKGEQKVQKE